MDLAGLGQAFDRKGLQRGRTVLAAGADGEVWALALAEHATLGMDPNGHMNTFRLVLLRHDLPLAQKRQVIHTLLRAVALFYRNLGRHRHGHHVHPGAGAHLPRAGLHPSKTLPAPHPEPARLPPGDHAPPEPLLPLPAAPKSACPASWPGAGSISPHIS